MKDSLFLDDIRTVSQVFKGKTDKDFIVVSVGSFKLRQFKNRVRKKMFTLNLINNFGKNPLHTRPDL